MGNMTVHDRNQYERANSATRRGSAEPRAG